MEIIELNYKNFAEGKSTVIRVMLEANKYYIQLPERQGRERGELIVIDGDSWSLLENETDVISEELQKEIDYLKEQFEYILNVQKAVKLVRKRRLEIRLKKLGYSSIESVLSPIRDHSEYCDLNEICKELEDYEDYIEIQGFSRRETVKIGNFSKHHIIYSAPTPEAKASIISMAEKISEDIKIENEKMKIISEMEVRKKAFIEGTPSTTKALEYEMTFPGIMSMSESDWEDYSAYITRACKDYWPKGDDIGLQPFEIMPEDSLKLPQSKPIWQVQLKNGVWNKYADAIFQIAKLYLSLNADLLPEKVLKKVTDYTHIYGEECEEYTAGEDLRCLISDFIDSNLFTLACNIEDVSICAKNLDFIRLIDSFLAENGEVIVGGMRTSIDELREDSTVQITERMRHVAMFHNAQIKLKQLRKPAPAPDFEDGIR